MSNFEIEKSVPLPPPPMRGRKSAKYPLADMGVGDSFLVPTMKPEEKRQSLYQLVSLKGRSMGRRFVVRVVDGGVRVWRTE